MRAPIIKLRGVYYLLSNFYPAPILYEGLWYRSTEAAYQAAKTVDEDVRRLLANAKNGGEARKIGQTLLLRDDWEAVKLDVMGEVTRFKYSHYPELGAFLMATGDAFIQEGNDWGDTFWGVCLENGQWVGQNHLGKLLMSVREELTRARGS